MNKRGLIHAIDFTGRLMVSQSKFADEATAVNSWLQNEAASQPDDADRALAQSFLDREPEDFTFIDPDDVKRLARAVLAKP